jgi:hypothetical protein
MNIYIEINTYANRLEVDCAGRGLDSIPTDLPSNTYYL